MSVAAPTPAETPAANVRDAKTRDWDALAGAILDGEPLSREDALAILAAPDRDVPALVAAAHRLRERHSGDEVQLYYLRNAKSGLCPENCKYCSQAIDSEAAIDKYALRSEEQLLAGARRAAETGAGTYCIVASGRGPSDREVDRVCETVSKIKDELGLHICACLGVLKPDQAARLRDAGVNRINHNLNTSRRHTPEVVTTHTYDDRLETLKVAKEAGLELCSGLIVGMGQTDADLVDVAFELRDLDVHSIPVNFLIPIDGAKMGVPQPLTPRDCLRALCLFRMANPASELRIAGGREVHLRSLQAMALYVANSVFVSDYLTTEGRPAAEDHAMIADLGFTVVTHGEG